MYILMWSQVYKHNGDKHHTNKQNSKCNSKNKSFIFSLLMYSVVIPQDCLNTSKQLFMKAEKVLIILVLKH